ncbi:hypothetical protein K2173_007915 [Erythroxylum novogranatense]|uniref:Exocyst subunit Exo70 family protein n=1 Tax=Erythroxylum novogranatense TaxID=1862640 RepID=A0AAV8T6R3_9ROSI|nr:hypothetical protein K2173_007915 [Erythroxylum novogranatense]
MTLQEENSTKAKLELACSDLKTLLQISTKMEDSLGKMGKRFEFIDESLSTASRRVAPLHSMAMVTRALETRINRAVSPAFIVLDSFKLSESLQHKLLEVSNKLPHQENPEKQLKNLLKYVDCVDKLNAAINSISRDGEQVIQKLQEVVEFLSRTKATDHFRTHRLRETMLTLKALYDTEVSAMKFDGLLDEALLNLQDEYESRLQQLRHENVGDTQREGIDEGETAVLDLGSELEIELLRRISETLASNDCLDICIDIFVKVRYRRAAKALMRLNPDYLRTYTPEEIDEMEWETLETVISLWIQHFELAVKKVLVSEKRLCNQLLGGIMGGAVRLECFVKIADKIMAVFFRFGEGVARSNKEPQKLFKLLDLFDSLEKLKTEFAEVFEGEAGVDICTRFRELEKLLIHASSKVFWEFGLQIEGNSDGYPPPQDGSVPKLVRYAINYLKYLATESYSAPMAKVLWTEQIWKAGALSKPESEDNLLVEAVTNVMEALQRNIESKRSRYTDKILSHVFAMNTYWYIYMRTKNTELGKLLGEQYTKKKYKVVAEEAAYMYQKQAWGPLIRLLDKEELKKQNYNNEARVAQIKGKLETFLKSFNDITERHRECYAIPDIDLREQIRQAIVKLVVTAYIEFFDAFSNVLPAKSYVSPESIQGLLVQTFVGVDRLDEAKLKQRDSRIRGRGGRPSMSIENVVREFRKSRANNGGG